MLFAVLTIASPLLTNAVQIADAFERGLVGESFSFTGTITLPPGPNVLFTAIDETGGASLYVSTYRLNGQPPLKAGDRITAEGKLAALGTGILIAECSRIDLLSRGLAPTARTVRARDLQTGRLDGFPIEIAGTVRECFRDEIDPEWTYLSVNDGQDPFFAVLPNRGQDFDGLRELENADVTIRGICLAHDAGNRRMTGRMVLVPSPESIQIRRAAAADPFAVPRIEDWQGFSPDRIARMGRRKLRGKVIAVLENGNTLLRTACGATHHIRFKREHPPCGAFVEAAGLPETDLYRVNLTNAEWCPIPEFPLADDSVSPLSAADLFMDGKGHLRINSRYHGQTVRLVGTIMDLPTTQTGQGIATLKSQDFTIPLDISADSRIREIASVGCEVEVTGVCFVQTENWSPCTPFPHTTGIALALRTADDIRILSRPPWLTPARMTMIVAALLLALVLILIWNRILQRIIDRKSRQLLKEQVAQIKATLRVDERTHLAVELHDTLSQNLSGVACQIAATKGTLPDGADETARYLETAERMLLSCRTELRRCLWDLRGDTLEETNFTEAIRKTLAPVAIGVETVVRFNVARSRLSDTTAHAVLCIIRELVANAIRHGKAKTIRVAGEFHDGVLSFSVRDDGRGFNPFNCNGPAEGHFGLEGIRERIKHLDGSFEISSEPGKGTRAEVTLTSILPKDEETET